MDEEREREKDASRASCCLNFVLLTREKRTTQKEEVGRKHIRNKDIWVSFNSVKCTVGSVVEFPTIKKVEVKIRNSLCQKYNFHRCRSSVSETVKSLP